MIALLQGLQRRCNVQQMKVKIFVWFDLSFCNCNLAIFSLMLDKCCAFVQSSKSELNSQRWCSTWTGNIRPQTQKEAHKHWTYHNIVIVIWSLFHCFTCSFGAQCLRLCCEEWRTKAVCVCVIYCGCCVVIYMSSLCCFLCALLCHMCCVVSCCVVSVMPCWALCVV